jgi:ABC-2 type transport system permease protein
VIDLVGAEFLKLRSTRTALGLLIAAVVVSVGPAALVMSLLGRDVLVDQGASLAALAGLAIVPLLTVVFGVLGMTNEYRHGTITYTYLATPRRWLVIAIKLVCYALVGAAVMAATALLTVAVIGAVAAIRDIHLSWLQASHIENATTVRDIALYLVTVGLMTAFGVGLGALFRAQIPTIAGVLVWALAVENIVVAVKPKVGMYLPFAAFQQLNVGGSQGSNAVSTLTRPQAFLVGVAYIAAVSIAAVFLSMRRDVT